ncbi:MAG TPA: sigma factor-like helix-turn-helix DNA-binding protein [Actinomycetota bacterium]|nr:sigma factor-like helix-turn-helix DNA-binding protein [Actinomycetota bacterium]
MFSFAHPGDVVRALERSRDCFDPSSTSLMIVAETKNPHRDPFGRGFIAGFEERTELRKRLARLDERSRALVILWHAYGHPVAQIARRLGISRVHCYRLERRALDLMIDQPEGGCAEAVGA